jgi:hypothetical protein
MRASSIGGPGVSGDGVNVVRSAAHVTALTSLIPEHRVQERSSPSSVLQLPNDVRAQAPDVRNEAQARGPRLRDGLHSVLSSQVQDSTQSQTDSQEKLSESKAGAVLGQPSPEDRPSTRRQRLLELRALFVDVYRQSERSARPYARLRPLGTHSLFSSRGVLGLTHRSHPYQPQHDGSQNGRMRGSWVSPLFTCTIGLCTPGPGLRLQLSSSHRVCRFGSTEIFIEGISWMFQKRGGIKAFTGPFTSLSRSGTLMFSRAGSLFGPWTIIIR